MANNAGQEHCPLRREATKAMIRFPPNTRDGMTLIRLQREFVLKFMGGHAPPRHRSATTLPYSVEEHDYLKRRAIEMVVDLPQNTPEAMMVLDYEEEFLLDFLDEGSGFSEESSSNVTAFSASARLR